MPSLAVIIPVHNDAANLRQCLKALEPARRAISNLIVVNDGSTDESARVAAEFGAKVLDCAVRRGPAAARNLGAEHTQADVLLFLDADVRVHADTIDRVLQAFDADTRLAAVIGCYDDAPAAPGFVSIYKNLMHS